MIKEFIGTGKTVEEATAAAKAGLNAPAMADINVEVVVMPKKKFMGIFGGSDAKVKAWYNDGRKEKKPKPKKEVPAKNAVKKEEKKPQPQKEAAKKETAKKETAKKEAPKKEKPVQPKVEKTAKPKKVEAPAEEAEVKITEADIDKEAAVNYLKEMLKGLKVEDAEVTAKVADGALQIEINCDDYGIIIGRRGETLDSLQYLTSLAIKKSCDKYVRVAINVGNYREKRMDTLKNLARKNANYVLRTGRRYTFEPMNPYERRIIHTAVQEIDGVESISIGYGQDRRVVIQSTGGPRSRKNNAPAKNTAPKSDRADLPKFGKIEVNKNE